MATERELKYSTSDEHVPSNPELAAALEGSDLELEPQAIERHRDVYVDTSERALLAAGVALRRRERPTDSLATLKGPLTLSGALHSRDEIELPIGPDGGWPKAIVAALPAGVPAAALEPVAELHVRRVLVVARLGGDPIAAIAFDEVECHKPGVADEHLTFHEVEIEALTEGSAATRHLSALADAVDSLVPLTPSSHSKLERALALLSLLD